MNDTFQVASLFDCDAVKEAFKNYKPDLIWGQTLMGCKVVELLQEMYGFTIEYVYGDKAVNDTGVSGDAFGLKIDFYARPMELRADRLDDAYPIIPIFVWRLGFLLRRPESNVFQSFYSKPFTRPLWNGLYGMALLVSIIFYLLTWCEKRLLSKRVECSFLYELFLTTSAYCQHVLPLKAILNSRRIAYFVFVLFTYLIYSFYGSNLLSHLVSDREKAVTLHDLEKDDYKYSILDTMRINVRVIQKPSKNLSIILEKLSKAEYMNVSAALEALKTSKTAVLSDFVSIYPALKTTFSNEEICGMVEVEVWSNVKKYFYSSKKFPYKEQFKIGLLKAREVGILRRLINDNSFSPRCAATTTSTPQMRLWHVIYPHCILGFSYIFSVLVLIGERIHYKRKVFPYVN